MKLPSDLNKEIQLARLYRAVAAFTELSTIFLLIWGLAVAVKTISELL